MVFKTENCAHPLYMGTLQKYSKTNIAIRLSQAFKTQFDNITFPLFSDEYLADLDQNESPNLDNSSIVSDQQLECTDHFKNIYLLVNKIINLNSKKYRRIFKFIVGYAVYLGLYAIVIPVPHQNIQEFIRYLNKYSDRRLFAEMHIILQLEYTAGCWQRYVDIRNSLSNTLKIDLMLSLNSQFPSQSDLNRFIAERIDYLQVFSTHFIKNSKGFPILSAVCEKIIKRLFGYKTKLIIGQSDSQNLDQHVKFIQFLFSKQSKPTDKQFESIRHRDHLQIPLQPYYDNLQSETYCVFQRDNAKYDEYELALTSALLTFPEDKKIIIFYIGSGRGALIYRALTASKKCNRAVFIYAIQKNPYPIQSLKRRIKANKWQKQVQIIFTDIKDWKPALTPDIFLSELLGGFGDNELSPQCLFWSQKYITKDTICIPYQYSSFVSPVSYPTVHRNLTMEQRQNYFVVNMHTVYRPSTVQKYWTFTHPLSSQNQFVKSNRKVFSFTEDNIIHGFAGYFDCDLFKGSRLSINPDDHTPDMYSWFSIYFAFRQAVKVAKDQKLAISVWRCTNSQKVWYQWQYEQLDSNDTVLHRSKVHNINGKVHSIFK